MAGGLLSEDGWRSDPGALTAAAADAARRAGATVRTGVAVKRLGAGCVLTDAGPLEASTVLLCAGAWSRTLARTAGHDLQVRPVRGWLAITAPGPPLLRHVVYEAEYEAPDGPQPALPVTVAQLAAGDLATAGAEPALAFAAHQNADGTVMIGATRSAALRETDESAAALRVTAERACRLLPGLAAREVATTWTGLRPFSHDGLPYIGWLEEGLAVCAGHGSEGVLTGAGSGRMVAEIVLGGCPTSTRSRSIRFAPRPNARPEPASTRHPRACAGRAAPGATSGRPAPACCSGTSTPAGSRRCAREGCGGAQPRGSCHDDTGQSVRLATSAVTLEPEPDSPTAHSALPPGAAAIASA